MHCCHTPDDSECTRFFLKFQQYLQLNLNLIFTELEKSYKFNIFYAQIKQLHVIQIYEIDLLLEIRVGNENCKCG